MVNTAAPLPMAAGTDAEKPHDLIDRVMAWHASRGMSKDECAKCEADLRAEFGGDMTYIGKHGNAARELRAREVLAKFNGRGATELARSMRIGRATVYRVLKQANLDALRERAKARAEDRSDRRATAEAKTAQLKTTNTAKDPQ